MLFASPIFLFAFLPLCLATYFLAPTVRLKNAVLILGSLIFYAWGEARFAPLIIGLTIFNYWAARIIDARDGKARQIALAIAIAVDLGALAVFKYAGFITANLAALAAPLGVTIETPHIPLPLGISFFTFHCLSYLIDTYRRRFPANHRFSEVVLYIAFFPQLIAGPIVRYKSIAKRLRVRRHSLGRVSAGLRIFVIGLAQKLLIADAMAPIADAVFDQAKTPAMIEAWLGAICYTLQIYFDFAGYSSMAIGLGVAFGFSLPRNFRTPYASASITEFWRRWHISLSTWFRDYLYIPLGGNRGRPWVTWRNLLIVFLLCGLWHGAAWTFVLWGLWHGAFLVVERMGLNRALAAAPRPLGWAYAMGVVVLGWVLFRSPDLSRAIDIWSAMAGVNGIRGFDPMTALALQKKLLWLIPLAGVLALGPRLKRLGRRWPTSIDSLVISGLLAICVLKVAAGTYSPFLYFRF